MTDTTANLIMSKVLDYTEPDKAHGVLTIRKRVLSVIFNRYNLAEWDMIFIITLMARYGVVVI